MTESKKKSKQQKEEEPEYAIKPEKGLPAMDTSDWPLLLKVNFYFILVKSGESLVWELGLIGRVVVLAAKILTLQY